MTNTQTAERKPFRVEIQAGRQIRTWTRFGVSAEQVQADAEKAVADEFDGKGRILHVRPMETAGYVVLADGGIAWAADLEGK